MSNNSNIELRSDEVQEILGSLPRWIVRWGITVIFLIIVVLLVGSYFYRYPDIIQSRVTVLSENPPVSIVARAEGKIDTIFISDKQDVEEGSVLGIIENPANYSDVLKLIGELDSLKAGFEHPDSVENISLNETYRLGEFQSFYSTLIAQMKEYHTFLSVNPTMQRIKSIEKQIADYRSYYRTMEDQAVVLKEDLGLIEKQFKRDSLLHEKGVISDIELEKSKASLLKQKYSYRSQLSGQANVKITINQLSQQIEELRVTTAESEKRLTAGLKESYDNLVNKLRSWEQAYVLKTPTSGKVTFNSIWAENQYVSAGSIVFSVVPADASRMIGKALVPVSGAGKTEIGQRVNIKLDNYPYMEFGFLEGRIEKISMVPLTMGDGSFYTAEISLPSGLVTNYRKVLPVSQEMTGVAEIITKERRLIERLVQPLVSLFRERMLTN